MDKQIIHRVIKSADTANLWRRVVPGFGLLLWLCAFAGCQSDFARFYVPNDADARYAPVAEVRVIQVGEKAVEPQRERLFPEATLLGSEEFSGEDQSEGALVKFAKSIGANVVVWHRGLIDTIVHEDYRTVPETETTYVDTYDENGDETRQRIDTNHDQVIPYTDIDHIYHHHVLYLRRHNAR